MNNQVSTICLNGIGPFLALLSAMLLVAGYVHLSILYSSFGVKLDQYFLLGDYISSSVEQIYHASWAAIGVLIGHVIWSGGMLIDGRDKSSLQGDDLQSIQTTARIVLWFVLAAVVLSVCYLIVCLDSLLFPDVSFMSNPTLTKYSFLTIGMAMILFVDRKLFDMSHATRNICLAALFFFTSLITNSYKTVEAIRDGVNIDEFTVKLGTQAYSKANSTIIGSNSRYLFVYLHDGSTQIVPLNQINVISLRKTGF